MVSSRRLAASLERCAVDEALVIDALGIDRADLAELAELSE